MSTTRGVPVVYRRLGTLNFYPLVERAHRKSTSVENAVAQPVVLLLVLVATRL